MARRFSVWLKISEKHAPQRGAVKDGYTWFKDCQALHLERSEIRRDAQSCM
ncbi:MAG: hypothetical protein V3V10_00600 [Planctomycetota bacterium]